MGLTLSGLHIKHLNYLTILLACELEIAGSRIIKGGFREHVGLSWLKCKEISKFEETCEVHTHREGRELGKVLVNWESVSKHK